MEKKNVILALDIGSSSVRCSGYSLSFDDDRANLSRVASAPAKKMRAVQPNTGRIPHVDLILQAVDACVDEMLEILKEQVKEEYEILAVGFSSFVMNLVGVDAEGKWVGAEGTISYACNTEAVSQEVQVLNSELGKGDIWELYKKTGAPLHSAYALPQLRVLYSTSPTFCESIEKWQTLASVCLSQWTGQASLPISYSEASWTGLLNCSQCEYEQSVIDLLPENCRDALPDLADFDEPAVLRRGIPESSPYYKRWPKLQDARLFLGLGDGACANIGSKCTIPRRIACTIGTSAAVRVCLPLPLGSESDFVEPGLFCYRINRAYVILGGALTDGGSVIEWVSQLLNLGSTEAFENCVEEVEELVQEDSVSMNTDVSLVMVPFLSGERSTGFRNGATGALLGLTRETKPAHLFKACLEGVTLRIDAIVELIRKAINVSETPRIIVSGSALELNALWRQMISDCTCLQVINDEDTQDGTSRGVASLLAMALGLTEVKDELQLEVIQSSKVSNPRIATQTYWKRAAKYQEDIIGALYGESNIDVTK